MRIECIHLHLSQLERGFCCDKMNTSSAQIARNGDVIVGEARTSQHKGWMQHRRSLSNKLPQCLCCALGNIITWMTKCFFEKTKCFWINEFCIPLQSRRSRADGCCDALHRGYACRHQQPTNLWPLSIFRYIWQSKYI